MADKTPLDLAREIVTKGSFFQRCSCYECGKAGIVAAALIERLTPVEVTSGQIPTMPCCAYRVSGYAEDYFDRRLPECCPNCGVPLKWKE